MALINPDLAKSMLKYRIQGMAAAQERAAEGGYNGARYNYSDVHNKTNACYRFPWEAAFTGVEVTPEVCPLCRENQQHITGDIAFAARSVENLLA